MQDNIELLAASNVHTEAIINYIDAKFEESDNHLAGLIWLHLKQIGI
ncbi:12053_t:CDS:2 [Cetraspora pellucida]|uniref:12053_t:CDS:1 n=1 Tax=Cetraspora pellucida TaxID=1433469 RepID=A0ACA9K3N1_9GLOM|nr:12053_t:CDS:2 [Cetraspora pellucida]